MLLIRTWALALVNNIAIIIPIHNNKIVQYFCQLQLYFVPGNVPRTRNCIPAIRKFVGRVCPAASFGDSDSFLIIDVYELTGFVVPGCKITQQS